MRQFDEGIPSATGSMPGDERAAGTVGGGGPAIGAQKVIVRDGGREVHGYVVDASGACAEVVWAVASGRQRRKSYPAEDVFVPSNAQQWEGVPIGDASLRLAARVGRGRAAHKGNGRPHDRRWVDPSGQAA